MNRSQRIGVQCRVQVAHHRGFVCAVEIRILLGFPVTIAGLESLGPLFRRQHALSHLASSSLEWFIHLCPLPSLPHAKLSCYAPTKGTSPIHIVCSKSYNTLCYEKGNHPAAREQRATDSKCVLQCNHICIFEHLCAHQDCGKQTILVHFGAIFVTSHCIAAFKRPVPSGGLTYISMLPFVEVKHLPSASSFYSTVLQPLGLRYISAADPIFSPSGSPSITYGSAAGPSLPVLELRQVTPTAERPLKRSRVVFSANSPSTVRSFQQKVTEADGRVFLTDDRYLLGQSPGPSDDWQLPVKATEIDLDGNIMDIVYVPPPQYPEGYTGSTVRRTSSSEGDISRIMTWNYDVATSEAPRTPAGPLTPGSSSMVSRHEESSPMVRRTITKTSTTFFEPSAAPAQPTLSARQNSSGLTAGAVVGTLLGVAAASAAIGAGVAYGAMKHERLRSEAEAPSFQRRSTYPEPLGPRSQYSEYGPGPGPRDYNMSRPPPTLLTRYPHSQSPRGEGSLYDDGRSRHSSRYRPSGASSIRTHSEAPSQRRPLLLTDGEHGSHVSASSKHTARTSEMDNVVLAPRSSQVSHASSSGGARSKHTAALPPTAAADRESYVSSRSHRTASTVRGPGPGAPMQPTAQTELSSHVYSRPKTASRVSRRADSYASAREGGTVRAAPSYVSGRDVALPMSGVGSSRAGYEQEDDLCSIAPSDSISCIGSSRKGSRVHV